MRKGQLANDEKLDAGARHEGRIGVEIVLDYSVVPHDGTPATDADPGERSLVVEVRATQFQQDGLHKSAGLGRMCRPRALAQDSTVHTHAQTCTLLGGLQKKNQTKH